MKALLDDAPSYRLGAGRDGLDSVKRHAFFRGFDWKSLADMSQARPLRAAHQERDGHAEL